jgi:predicted permease
VERGFDPENVLVVDLNLPAQRYSTPAAALAFYDALLPPLNALPGVESADVASTLLLSQLPNSASIAIENKPDLNEADANLPVPYDVISPGLLNTMRMPLLRGRQFDASDAPTATRVAIVNQAFAARFFPNEDVLGKRFVFGTAQGDSTAWLQIVGLVRDALRSEDPGKVQPYVFLALSQGPPARMRVVLRTRVDPITIVPRLRETLRRIDPAQPIANVRTLDQDLAATLAPRRFVLLLLATFAGAALLLAAIGIYGVISYMVNQRTREFGLRMALGAEPRSVLLLVLRQAGQPVLAGIILGCVGAFGAAQLLRSQLFGLSGYDFWTQGAVIGLLTLVAAAAAWLPARRATGADPLIALRSD